MVASRARAGSLIVLALLLSVLVVSPPTAAAADNRVTLSTTGNVGQYSSLALDSSGFAVVSYYDATTDDLVVARCGDALCSSGNTVRVVDSVGDVGKFSSLALDGSDRPVVSYYDETNGDLRIARCGDTTCTAGNLITTVDSIGDVGRHTSIVLDATDRPVVSYYDTTAKALKVLRCGDTTCSAGNVASPVDPVGNVGHFTSIALSAGGRPIVSYYDVGNGDLKVARCGNVPCSTGNVITAVDTAGVVGHYTSLTIAPGGLATVSYYDVTNGNLKVLRCSNVNCTASSSETIDSAGDVGSHTSIDVDAGGIPTVAYYDVTNTQLKVTRCADTSCAAVDSSEIVDSAGNVGEFASLVLDGSGNPVISYWDRTDADLKGVRCDDPACDSGELCSGQDITIDMNINGGDGTGTPGNDVILGTPGADNINGLGGNDIICGGFGADTINGGPGDDLIFGQQGGDTIDGGLGDDRVFGQGGDDELFGRGGNDALRGGVGQDLLEGHDGVDLLFGNNGTDELWGGNGGDRLRGQANPDMLMGEAGNDLVVGGGGRDTHDGGTGIDRCLEGADQGFTEVYISCEIQP